MPIHTPPCYKFYVMTLISRYPHLCQVIFILMVLIGGNHKEAGCYAYMTSKFEVDTLLLVHQFNHLWFFSSYRYIFLIYAQEQIMLVFNFTLLGQNIGIKCLATWDYHNLYIIKFTGAIQKQKLHVQLMF